MQAYRAAGQRRLLPENGLKAGLPLIHPEPCNWLNVIGFDDAPSGRERRDGSDATAAIAHAGGIATGRSRVGA